MADADDAIAPPLDTLLLLLPPTVGAPAATPNAAVVVGWVIVFK